RTRRLPRRRGGRDCLGALRQRPAGRARVHGGGFAVAASAPLSRLVTDAASGTARPAAGSGGTRRCAAVARAALDRRHRKLDRACPLSSLKEWIEIAALFQRVQIVGAADVPF